MNEINLVYIDDQIDYFLSNYLDNDYSFNDIIINYDEIMFNAEEGYSSLIENRKVESANIIIVDSRLFNNKTAGTEKITGEEFKLLVRRLFPFIEVIIITQNEISDKEYFDFSKVEKYKFSSEIKEKDYYNDKLKPAIDVAIKRILQFDSITEKFSQNNFEKGLKDSVIDSFYGISQYNNLTKDDIDNLIAGFKKLQERLDVE